MQVHAKVMSQLEAVLLTIPAGSEKMNLAHIESILEVPLFLDQFQDRLGSLIIQSSFFIIMTPRADCLDLFRT